jgi:hypothetical protein
VQYARQSTQRRLESRQGKQIGSDEKDLAKRIAKVLPHGAAKQPAGGAYNVEAAAYPNDKPAACLKTISKDGTGQY